MALTDTALRKVKPQEKAFKLSDSGGLYLFVTPSGGKLWRMNYRFNGKFKTLAIGPYPTVGLADARTSRDEAKKLLATGIDPAAEKRTAKVAAKLSAENTFGAVADEYLDRLRAGGAADATMKKNEWMLKQLVGSELRAKPVTDITPADILHLLQKIEKSGRLESARRMRSTISSVYKLAIQTLRAESDPAAPLQSATRAPVVKSHSAITDPKKFGALLCSIDEYDGWPTLRCALQFAALTACRPIEIRCAEWSEIDLKEQVWRIPAKRMKTRSAHEVALSRQAIDVLKDVAQISGRSRLVFPSIRSDERPLSENAMNSALRRMGYTSDEHTAHGFRSSFSTILNERRYDYEIIERALSHTDSSVRGIYNRAQYWDQRMKLMQDWADLLDEFRNMK